MKIRDMKIGASAQVVGYDTRDRMYRQKLLQMGLVKRAKFTLVRIAPMGDPAEIRLNGFSLTLRKAEADALNVELMV
jgi:ferrous iron transport protein A